ncbi:uncharacterized protein [Epargyreus clarus]|uniref:uncharacterized protein n=1 Tax=Epargyreus clarus TaxID=520877 RepID=UPI003C2B1FCD
MKVTRLFVMIMVVFALFCGTEAAPKINVKAIKKGGKVIQMGLEVISAAGTVHDIYSDVKNRKPSNYLIIMKFSNILIFVMFIIALLHGDSEARPGKIPVKAIKKGAQVIGKGLRAVNIASTAHDVYSFFHHKKKH